jgi:radical SAM superfamily enzyme YgiQ (UPF0313 family)
VFDQAHDCRAQASMTGASPGRGQTDVVLVRPQEHDYDYLQWHEDLALGHVLRELDDAGIATAVFDFALRPLLSETDYESAISEIAKCRPKIVIVVIDKHPTNSPYYAGCFIEAMRKSTGLRQVHLSIHGNTQVGTARLLDEFSIDSVIVGEEREACLLALAVVRGGAVQDVPGVVTRTVDPAKIRRNSPLVAHRDFSGSAPPKRYFFDLPEAERNPYGYVAAIEASRGCYAKCTFCYIRTKERVYGEYGWVGRSPAQVVDEMYDLYRRYSARQFSFIDPQFFGPGSGGQEWAVSLATLILERGMDDISFSIYARANDMRRPSLEALKAAGLYAVFIGVESFSDAVLKRYRKGVTVERNISAIKLLMDLNIRLRMGFVSFDHYTTIDELLENAAGLTSLLDGKPHLITQPVFFQNILAPLDDTPVGDHYRAIGAAEMAVSQPVEQLLLAKRQERLTRGGPVTVFSDPRVAFVSEMTRILASEITQRSTRIEIACSDYLGRLAQNSINIEGSLQSAESALGWLNGLTRFAIGEFVRLVHEAKFAEVGALDFGESANGIRGRMKSYDATHFSHSFSLASVPISAIID